MDQDTKLLSLSSVLYCTVLYWIIKYCTVLYCTVLYCTVLYCTVLFCSVLYHTVLYCIMCYFRFMLGVELIVTINIIFKCLLNKFTASYYPLKPPPASDIILSLYPFI